MRCFKSFAMVALLGAAVVAVAPESAQAQHGWGGHWGGGGHAGYGYWGGHWGGYGGHYWYPYTGWGYAQYPYSGYYGSPYYAYSYPYYGYPRYGYWGYPGYSYMYTQPGVVYTAPITTTTTVTGTPATIEVRVPDASAEVWVDGRKTAQTGMTRRFTTPPLEPGSNYSYRFSVVFPRDGEMVTENRTVD